MADISPFIKSLKEFKVEYYPYLGYKEKLRKYGLVTFELEHK